MYSYIFFKKNGKIKYYIKFQKNKTLGITHYQNEKRGYLNKQAIYIFTFYFNFIPVCKLHIYCQSQRKYTYLLAQEFKMETTRNIINFKAYTHYMKNEIIPI